MHERLRDCLVICGLFLAPQALLAQEPLQVRIDRLMDAAEITAPAPLCSDGEFLRRVYLDLIGTIPASAEARAFLDDPAATKREALVDRLLADPRHPLHLASAFNVMWMERRHDKHVPSADWLKYLVTSFQANKPYDQLVREILTADSADPAQRPAAKFLLDRDGDPHLLTRDIGRMFFGVDLQCAQCHDHPIIDDYLQSDYYGLYAFVSRTGMFLDPKDKNKGYLTETADGNVAFKSVFTGNEGKTRPRLIGSTELDEPRFPLGEDYVVAPGQNVRTVPKYSRRAQFGAALADGSHPAFRKNIVNRLWAKLMGRGLVHAVDLHHSDNPPSHPDVLNLLADEIQIAQFQFRPLLRGMLLTKTYQRSIDVPATAAPIPGMNVDSTLVAWAAEIEQHAAAANAAKAAADALLVQLTAAHAALAPIEEVLTKAEAAELNAKKPYDDANAVLVKAQQDAAAKQAALATVNDALAKGTEAAKVLPNDAEVTQAVAVFQARVTKLTADVEAANKVVADQTPVVAAALATLNTARAATEVAFTQWKAARQPADALKAQIIAAQNTHHDRHTAEQRLKQRLTALQTVVAQMNRPAAIAAAETGIATAQAEQTAAAQAVEVQVGTVNQLTLAMTEADKVRVAAQQQVEAAQATVTAKQPVVQAVAEAVTKTQEAVAKLPDDADLKAALDKLKPKQDALTKELTDLQQAVVTRTGEEQAAAATLKATQDAVTAGQTELATRKQTMDAKSAGMIQAVAKRDAEIAAGKEAQEKLIASWTTDAAVRDLKSLTPEQFGFSLVQATGVIDGQRAAADAEIEKTIPKAAAADPAQLTNRQQQVEQMLHQNLLGLSAVFVGFYAAAPGQPQDDFFATADQALFLANGGQLRSWIVPGAPLFNRLNEQADPKLFAEELYFSTLTRRPTEAEVAAVTNYLAARPTERPAVIQEMIWALLASAEFRFQH